MVGKSFRKIAVVVGALLVAGMMTMAAAPAGQPSQGADQPQASTKVSKKAKAPKANKAERLKASGKTININTATAAELTALPKIGAKQAQRIVDYRTEHKGFKSVDELRNVKGVGAKMLDGIRPYVGV
jgi:competence protein ComEA